MLKIAVDENISYAEETFSKLGEVTLFNGRRISNNDLKNFDALVIRSVTKVNKELLNGTNIKFTGTATIGTDHVDKEYLKENGIEFSDAKGCNSYAVAEYVITAIVSAAVEKEIELDKSSIGIIGAGNIGSIVADFCETLGMKVILNDPPLALKTGSPKYREIEEALSARFITMHIPLEYNTQFPTYHLFDKKNLEQTAEDAIIINASRGEVLNSNEVLSTNKKNRTYILDVWENEPEINTDLLKITDYASPHIAGYTEEGKLNGTLMIFNALKNFLKKEILLELPQKETITIEINKQELSKEKLLNSIMSCIYRHKDDTLLMRRADGMRANEISLYFDSLRKTYKVRKEFSQFKIIKGTEYSCYNELLKKLRFRV